MSAFWQNVVALAVVAACAFWIVRRMCRILMRSQQPGCGSCGSCSDDAGKSAGSTIPLEVLAKSAPPKQ